MNIIVAHPGKQHSMQTAIGLQKKGLLCQYITTVYDRRGSFTHFVQKFLKGEEKKKANGRKNDSIPNDKISQFCEIQGLVLLLITRIPYIRKLWGRYNKWLTNHFGIKVAKYAIRNNVDAVIMYDSTCNSAFEYLKSHAPNIKRILDCSISNRAYNKKIYEHDIEISGDREILYEQAYLWGKEGVSPFLTEIQLSDYFLVPSEFVKTSVVYAGAKKEQVLMIPYGVGSEFFFERKRCKNKKPLKLLYVGAIIRRKGLHHLLKVISQYPDNEVELYLAGGYSADYDLYTQYKEYINIHFLGFVTRDRILKLYDESDCFILPSLAEGLALVGLEAMATGLPIICSSNTGVNELVENYKNGIVFETSDDDALKAAIDWFINNKDRLYDMGLAAKDTAKEYSWERYYKNLQDKIEQSLL